MVLHFKNSAFLMVAATAVAVGSTLVPAAAYSQQCQHVFNVPAKSLEVLANKKSIQVPLAKPLTRGVIQLTGADNKFAQVKFPNRTPADPITFIDKKTGETRVYGTQVDGTGFLYLKYKNLEDMLRNEKPEIDSEKVYLPNGKALKGKEAIWDTNRVAYDFLEQAFSKEQLAKAFRDEGIDAGTDLYYAGIALQPNGKLGRWTTDNWRRRNHVMAYKNGKLQILESPVFNKIADGMNEKAYPGFGKLPFLLGDYIGHAYGPNFKLVKNGEQTELWIISEEVTRRVEEKNGPVEVTEIVARKMISPFEASKQESDRVVLLTVNGKDGKPHPDSDRGAQMAHTKLIEGFRPPSMTAEGLRITKKEVVVDGRRKLVDAPELANEEVFVMAGSQGNFAGDQYDALLAFRKGSPIGEYEMVTNRDGSWKKYLAGVKRKYNLSWAGRPSFVQGKDGRWFMQFHGVDKDIRPDGSYEGPIPGDTETYHRNIYMVPVEFYQNRHGQTDMNVLL